MTAKERALNLTSKMRRHINEKKVIATYAQPDIAVVEAHFQAVDATVRECLYEEAWTPLGLDEFMERF